MATFNSQRHIRLTEANRISKNKLTEDTDLECAQRLERSRKRRVTKWQRGNNLQRMQAAVKRVRVHGESISGVALRTGLPERTLRRYVDLSKNEARKDNPIFFRPLAPHEKLPKHLREDLDELVFDNGRLSHTINLLKKPGALSASPRNTMKYKSMPYKRRYSEDGRKICRCGSTTHKNTLHRLCPLNKKKVKSSQHQEAQTPDKTIQTAAASPTEEACFPTDMRKSCVAMGDRLKLLVSIALAQTVKAQKPATSSDGERLNSSVINLNHVEVPVNNVENRGDDDAISKGYRHPARIQQQESPPVEQASTLRGRNPHRTDYQEIDEHSAIEALADLTSECKNASQQQLQQLEHKKEPKNTEISASMTKIEQANESDNAHQSPPLGVVRTHKKESWQLAPLPKTSEERNLTSCPKRVNSPTVQQSM